LDEVARIVGRGVRIVRRADSGFTGEALMAWCEANRVDYVFGLARTCAWKPGSPPPSRRRGRCHRRRVARVDADANYFAAAGYDAICSRIALAGNVMCE
jgi:Transposase DDE domain group 1